VCSCEFFLLRNPEAERFIRKPMKVSGNSEAYPAVLLTICDVVVTNEEGHSPQPRRIRAWGCLIVWVGIGDGWSTIDENHERTPSHQIDRPDRIGPARRQRGKEADGLALLITSERTDERVGLGPWAVPCRGSVGA
jgi:hypothetical protein